MPPKKSCYLCKTAPMTYDAFKNHLLTKHRDEIINGLKRQYSGWGSPPPCLSVSLADNEKEIYVCAYCQNIWFSEKSYRDHYILSECKNLSKRERQNLMEQYTGLTFPNLHIGEQTSISPTPVAPTPVAPTVMTKNNMCVCQAEIKELKKQIAELIAWKNSIIAAAPPTNVIVEAPVAKVLISEIPPVPVEQQYVSPHVKQMAVMKSVNIPAENKPTCVHCGVQDDANYVSCAKCQKPMHFLNDYGYCSNKTRMCAHEDCEDVKLCETCAYKVLGEADDDEDDLCARHRH